MAFTQYEQLKHRHDQLVAQFNETESDDALTEIAVIELALYAAGYLTYGEEPFADLAPAPSGDDERMHCSLCGTPIYEDIISGNPDAPLIPLDENGECPECAAAPAPSGDQEAQR